MEMYFKRMKDEWTGLVEQADPPIRAKAAEIAVAHAHYLSIEFYRIVRIDPHAEEFLSNEQVERQLKSAMERWIINVLSAQVDDVERLIQIQHTVAEVHARIGIPVEIVEMGFRVLKKILYPVIFSSDYSAAEKLQVYHFSINSIDIAMEVMTRAFTFSDSSASKEDENYRIFSLLENAEEEKERQIASILSWEIDIIYKILLDSDLGSSLPLSQADFGLWFNHKGRHYFSGIAAVGHISRLIQDFDGIFNQTMRNTRNLNNRSLRVKFLLQIRNTVSQIITLLRELFEEVSRHEVGMDVLTKLLNRRFLPTIFKREIAHANRTGTPLSVLMFRCSHCATGCRYTGRHLPTVQKFKMRKAGQRPFVSVMARLRGSCKLKPRQEQKPAPLSNAWQISASIWPRWRWNRKKAVSILNNSSNLIR